MISDDVFPNKSALADTSSQHNFGIKCRKRVSAVIESQTGCKCTNRVLGVGEKTETSLQHGNSRAGRVVANCVGALLVNQYTAQTGEYESW